MRGAWKGGARRRSTDADQVLEYLRDHLPTCLVPAIAASLGWREERVRKTLNALADEGLVGVERSAGSRDQWWAKVEA